MSNKVIKYCIKILLTVLLFSCILVSHSCSSNNNDNPVYYHAIFRVDGIQKDLEGGYFEFSDTDNRWQTSWYSNQNIKYTNELYIRIPNGTSAGIVFYNYPSVSNFQVMYWDESGTKYEVVTNEVFTLSLTQWNGGAGGTFSGTLQSDMASNIAITEGSFDGIRNQ